MNPKIGVFVSALGVAAMGADARPLVFESEAGGRYVARAGGYSVLLESGAANVRLNSRGKHAEFRLHFVRGRKASRIEALEPLPGTSNYYLGNREHGWRTGVRQFGRVRYSGVYPGIDVEYYAQSGSLEYDLVLAPGASPEAVSLRLSGASDLRLTPSGELSFRAAGEPVLLKAPVAWQPGGSTVDARYEITDGGLIRFAVGDYDRTKKLVIDPVLVYSTLLGGNVQEEATAVAADAEGNLYVAGETNSIDLPSAGPQLPRPTASVNTFIMKLSPDGKTLLWSTYFGGRSTTRANAIALDVHGNVYLTGRTGSADFPLKDPVQSQQTGLNITFLTRLDKNGAITFSTLYGGDRNDEAHAIAVDANGNMYVGGRTNSDKFPTKNAMQAAYGGNYDGIIYKIDGTTKQLVWATHLGTANNDEVFALAVDGAGRLHIAGETQGNTLGTEGSYQKLNKGSYDAFVARMSQDGTRLEWATHLGGSGWDRARALALDSAGNVYVGGATNSQNFPVSNGAAQTTFGGSYSDGFVAKLAADGAALFWATYIGGSGANNELDDEQVTAVVLDGDRNVLLAGSTASVDLPTVRPMQAQYGGGDRDAFVAKLRNDGSAWIYSSFWGGDGLDSGQATAIDARGYVYLAGQTFSKNYKLENAVRSNFSGTSEAFAVRFCDPWLTANPNGLTFTWTPGQAAPAAQTFKVTACAKVNFAHMAEGGFPAAQLDATSTDASVTVSVNTAGRSVGDHQGSVTFTSPDAANTLVVPVTLRVLPPPPVFTVEGVVNAASGARNAVAPGEMIVIYGADMGPQQLVQAWEADAEGRLARSLAGTRVLFDGVPAAMVYTRTDQIAAIVPYAVAGHTSTNIVVEYMGVQSASRAVPVRATLPGIFTLNQTGSGPGAILNNGTALNSAENPADKGSVIVLYATGEGATDPAGIDGKLATAAPYPKPLAPVRVTIGGVECPIEYAGGAPWMSAGIFQVNVRVAAGVPSGAQPIMVQVGEAASDPGVTVAIR